ncbi:hypothetical protein SMSP2_01038 [Limihaloglobus sulfuriphilus]|uniref:Uncharacterized protein n=1 Tax=Limihaloglobus sulfuriphilus TaxID=1851148 RepID=A0A1Q2MDC0_9BACT|nr:hypothetical protein [Limihaloglobus sulfuriphilus]AQQ70681.1 hypothetical protein SMSP2_01038 [Limihaloglobus sulfuriphilus]
MSKSDLLESAKQLRQPSEQAANEYAQKRAKLVSEVDRILISRPDLIRLIGEGNKAMMQDNHKNHALFMESMFKFYDPQVLVETVLWVFRAYRSHNFHQTYWPAQLNAWLAAMESLLSNKAYDEIVPFYNYLIVNIPVFSNMVESGS